MGFKQENWIPGSTDVKTGTVAQPVAAWTAATCFITPLLKKPSLDAADVTSYRPISNSLVYT